MFNFRAWHNHHLTLSLINRVNSWLERKEEEKNNYRASCLMGQIRPLEFKTNKSVQSTAESHLVQSHSVHLSATWKTCCAQYLTGAPVCIHSRRGRHWTATTFTVCSDWRYFSVCFLTFAGHFCCDPASSPLFLALPLSACTTQGFFWPPQHCQQYKAWLA